MEKIIEKIEVYHFINYLLPGIIFGTIFTEITQKNLFNYNIILAIIEYYFVGLLLSRIGSIIIKPMLERLKIITCVKYSQYINCSKTDDKVELLQREANQYRTYISVFLCLTILEIYYSFINNIFYKISLLFLSLTVLFILSYRKQLKFITERLQYANHKK